LVQLYFRKQRREQSVIPAAENFNGLHLDLKNFLKGRNLSETVLYKNSLGESFSILFFFFMDIVRLGIKKKL